MKKIIKISIIAILIMISFILIDTAQARIFKRSPIISWKEKLDKYSWVNKGIIIDTYYCVKEKDILTVSWHLKNYKFTCAINNNDTVKVNEITDTTKNIENFVCAEALESFYEDENYIYYWNCIKNNYMIVKYENGYEETISNALKNKTITINDLDKYKINYIKQEKDIPSKDFKISIIEEENCNLKLNEYYKNNGRTIYTSCLKEIYIERDNIKRMTLKYHLENVNQSFDRSIKQLISDATIYSYLKDGGTKIYKKDDYTIINCNTINGNKDIYIGNKDFKYEQGFCK